MIGGRGMAGVPANAAELDDPSQTMDAETMLVSPRWLHAQDASAVTILDGSWHMPAAGRDASAEFAKVRIPGAAFFDIDAIADRDSGLPHMLPSAEAFAVAMRQVGVSPSRPVVVYGSADAFSSPRVWWTLKAFGHPRVAVLNGGLPRWLADGYPVDEAPTEHHKLGEDISAAASRVCDEKARVRDDGWALQPALVRNLSQIRERLASWSDATADKRKLELVVDARSEARFRGDAPEPRAGLRGGHMPASANVPFDTLLDASQQNTFKAAPELRRVFQAAGVDLERPGGIVTSCGSGVTAAVVLLALGLAGRRDGVAVYDGSWTEYGGQPESVAPVLTGPADLPAGV